MKRNYAFTLIELLVVIAIIAILAAILFPVFAQAKAAAKKTQALTHAKEQGTSTFIYQEDSDDLYPLWFFTNSQGVWPTIAGGADSNVHYALYPYQKNYNFWSDPMDPVDQKTRDTFETTYPSSSAPSGFTQQQLIFNLGLKTDFGVNCQFMHPAAVINGKIIMHPVSQTMMGNSAKTIYSISSLWDRTSAGAPVGGGNYEVDAPCWKDTSLKDLRPGFTGSEGYYWYGGWNPGSPLAWNVYGGVWPWHLGGTQVVIVYCDSHAHTKPMVSVAAGCNVKDGSSGTAYDLDKYEWDITQ